MNNPNQIVDAKTSVILIPGDRYFPEHVTATADGTFFVGSLNEGCIMRAQPGADRMEPFIESGTNGLVSVLGLYVDEANNTLWACSADADNGKLKGTAKTVREPLTPEHWRAHLEGRTAIEVYYTTRFASYGFTFHYPHAVTVSFARLPTNRFT